MGIYVSGNLVSGGGAAAPSECPCGHMFNVGDGLRPRTHCTWLQCTAARRACTAKRAKHPSCAPRWRRARRCACGRSVGSYPSSSELRLRGQLRANSSCYGNDLGWLLRHFLYFCIIVVSYDEFCVTAHGVTGVSHRALGELNVSHIAHITHGARHATASRHVTA